MRCIKTKKLNRGSYSLRQSQAKMLDIQNGWNDDWMPLAQSLSLSLLSLCHIFFLYRYTFFFSSAYVFFSEVSHTGKYDHWQILILYCMTDPTLSLVLCLKKKNLVRGPALDESSQMCCAGGEEVMLHSHVVEGKNTQSRRWPQKSQFHFSEL